MEHLYHIRTSQKKNKKNSKKLGPLLGTPDMLGLLYNNMAIGRIRKSKKSFGSVMRSAPAMAPGVPPAYPLNFYNHSFLGVPLYHFRSDWKTSAGLPNFTAVNGGPAKVGDLVKMWKNAYLSGDEGAAKVPPPSLNGGNFYGTLGNKMVSGYPTLVENTYRKGTQTQTLQGLKFTGLEYMQIDGASVTNPYGIDGQLFNTAGTDLMTGPYSKSGASFLFVIDSDMIDYDEGDQEQITDERISGLQALLYGRKMNCMTTPGYAGGNNGLDCANVYQSPPFGPKYFWPDRIEDYGLQVWFNNRNRYPNEVDNRFPGLGPHNGNMNPVWNHRPIRGKPIPGLTTWGPDDGLGMGSMGALGGGGHGGTPPSPEAPPYAPGDESPHLAPKMMDGFQILLYEFDANDIFSNWTNGQSGWGPGYQTSVGPRMKLYTYGSHKYPQHASIPPGVTWEGANSLVVPRSLGNNPASPNATLFLDQLLFLGGFPPVNLGFGQLSSGFRGTIYEAMMFEGKLSTADKEQLEKEFSKRYAQAIR